MLKVQFSFLFLLIISSFKLFSQDNKADIQNLIDQTMPFIKNSLEENKQLIPTGATIDQQDFFKLSMIYKDTDEVSIISEFKQIFRKENLKANYKAVGIFYNVIATNPKTAKKGDAIAIHVEHQNEKQAHIYYYPYRFISENEIEILSAFDEVVEKEILK